MTLNERVALAVGGADWVDPDYENDANLALAAYAKINKREWALIYTFHGWTDTWVVRLRLRIALDEVEGSGPTFAAALSEAVAKAGERDAK